VKPCREERTIREFPSPIPVSEGPVQQALQIAELPTVQIQRRQAQSLGPELTGPAAMHQQAFGGYDIQVDYYCEMKKIIKIYRSEKLNRDKKS
jgi:hypothetical protein